MKINKEMKYLLNEPKNQSNKGIILLPGISGGALGSYYDDLARALSERGFYFLRLELWSSEKDLVKKSLNDIYVSLNNAVQLLRNKGCTKIGFVGKSFGGGILLTFFNQLEDMDKSLITSLVLWAPAIGFGKQSNLRQIQKLKFSNFRNFDEIKIDKTDLNKIIVPVLLIQGTKDSLVSKGNTAQITKSLPNAHLKYIEGAEHSYNKKEEMKEVIKETINFLLELN